VTEEASQRAGPPRQSFTQAASDRERWNLVVLCVSLVVLVVTSLAARAELTSAEEQIFRAVNELPEGLKIVVWPFMQYGTFITVPALTVIALLFRRYRLAVAIALAGVGVYVLALAVKQVVDAAARALSSRASKDERRSARRVLVSRRDTRPSRLHSLWSWPPTYRCGGWSSRSWLGRSWSSAACTSALTSRSTSSGVPRWGQS
jgi:hypothetical protein